MKARGMSYLGMGLLFGVALKCWAGCGHVYESMTEDAIIKRIEPIGAVDLSGDQPAPKTEKTVTLAANAGEKRYKSTCAVCHDAGIGGAPKFRDKTDWAPRVATGMDEMLRVAIQGKGAMPPRGTCMQCSDEEIRKTIEYMIPQ